MTEEKAEELTGCAGCIFRNENRCEYYYPTFANTLPPEWKIPEWQPEWCPIIADDDDIPR